MIVEFFGMPGSGKTTLVRDVGDALGLPSRVLRPVRSKQFKRHPLAALRATWHWGSLKRRWGEQRELGTSLVKRRIHQDIHSEAREWFLIEEGVVYHIWRELFLVPALADGPWRELLRTAEPLIVLDTPAATRHARIVGRGGAVKRELNAQASDGPSWKRGEELLESVVAEAERHRPVARIDTDCPLEEARHRVEERVKAFGAQRVSA